MKLTANIIGATGLVGKQLVQLLLEDDNFDKVRIFVRRNSGLKHPKLKQHIVKFSDIKTWEKDLNGDVLFSALGTTLIQAGNKKAQYEVDFTFNLNFAKAAKHNNITNYVLVSSIGANSKSKIFYTRIKGELDDAVAKLEFEKLTILRPSSLIGNRKVKRIIEIISIPFISFFTIFILKKYRPIKAKIVAQAMINRVLKPDSTKTIWEGNEIFKLAEKI
ncbi:MAG: NAD(P)H-binding protein [Draconibacterium sp.]|nr:NAD(P)H-binding protein [Draconibacterium sp.]